MKKPKTEKEWIMLVKQLQDAGDDLATAINDPDYHDTLDDSFQYWSNLSEELDEFLCKPTPNKFGVSSKSIEEILEDK